jgi:preprotein translocase subunit YajC
MFIKDAVAQITPTAPTSETTATTAQTVATTPVPAVPTFGESLLSFFVTLTLMYAVFYFFVIRPQKRRHLEHRNMTKTLAKGDKIVLGDGIIGVVKKVNNDDTLLVEISETATVQVIASTIMGPYKPLPPKSVEK